MHSFITSRLDYCNSLYIGVSQTCVSRLQLVQNAAARLLKRKRKRSHITPVLISLHWLPVKYRIEFKVLLFVFKYLWNQGQQYLSDLLHPLSHSRTLRSRDSDLLAIPRSRFKNRGDCAFAIAVLKLWNSLPAYISSAQSLSTFKSALNTFLFSLLFSIPWSISTMIFLFFSFLCHIFCLVLLKLYSMWSTLLNICCFLNVL